jgi:ATP-dependent Zn protease
VNNHLRTILVWLVFLGVVVIAYQIFATASEQRKDLDASEFYKLVDAGEIQEVNVSGDAVGYDIQGKFKSPQPTATGQPVPNFRVYTVKDDALMKTLRD